MGFFVGGGGIMGKRSRWLGGGGEEVPASHALVVSW